MSFIKSAASSQMAGYNQSRQGRRPIRVDTLLERPTEALRSGRAGLSAELSRLVAQGYETAKEALTSKQKKASLVPPFMHQLVLDILDSLDG